MNILSNKNALSVFIFTILKPYKTWIFLMALIGLMWAFINTFTPYILKMIIDHVLNYQGNMKDLVNSAFWLLWAYIGIWVSLAVSMRFLDWIKLKFFPSIREDIMRKMFGYLNLHSYQYFQNNFAGSLINKITDMQGGVIEILTVLDDLYAQMLGILVAVITLSFVQPIFSMILISWILLFISITYVFLKPIGHLSHIFAESKTAVVGKMVDSISNIANVRLFSKHQDENRYIHENIKIAIKNDRKLQAKIIYMRAFWDVSIITLLGLNVFLLLNMYSHGQVTIGDFTFVIMISINILWNLWFLASQSVSFIEHIGFCKQALSIITAPHQIVDRPDAKSLKLTEGKIEFKNVTFNYDKDVALFSNTNIIIPSGQKVGLVGFSGGGKSTFVNLILRLFEVTSGNILIDNQEINHVTQQSLREQIALIPQDVSLFHRSLFENIRFGNNDASDADIIAVAKKSHCHEFITQLPHGYDSLVGERGVKLSGGQRQRIAIARAMLKSAPILILDEATSSLDSITEKYIQEALRLLMQHKTCIVIAHRLSTLSQMDRILVFHQGKIIEDGTHDELLGQEGHYAKMWHMQAGGFLPESEN